MIRCSNLNHKCGKGTVPKKSSSWFCWKERIALETNCEQQFSRLTDPYEFTIFINDPSTNVKSLWTFPITFNIQKNHTIISFSAIYFWAITEIAWNLTAQNRSLCARNHIKNKSKAVSFLTGTREGDILGLQIYHFVRCWTNIPISHPTVHHFCYVPTAKNTENVLRATLKISNIATNLYNSNTCKHQNALISMCII